MTQQPEPRRIAVIGCGYVGSVAAAGLAHIGHQVVGIESDATRLEHLRSGVAPFHEPGLDALLTATLASGHLSFTDDITAGIDASDVIFVCVGTPPGSDGLPDMSAMSAAAKSIASNLRRPCVIVTKSTVPIGTGRWITSVIRDHLSSSENPGAIFSVVANPEFLREGNAVDDFLRPERIVLGSDDPEALRTLADIYRPIVDQSLPGGKPRRDPVPLICTDLATGEMTKYASNAFLATKISFANEIARLCDFVGADVTEVTAAMGLDSRIGGRFLNAGLGWGGSCFGKDLSALVNTAIEYGYHPRLLEASMAVNDGQRQLIVDELLRHLRTLRGARICLLGLAFKPGTDDLRDSPALDVGERLAARGAFVTGFDPMVKALPDGCAIRLAEDPYAAAAGAEALVVATEWQEFLNLDLTRIRKGMDGDIFFDARNLFDPEPLRLAGFRCFAIGRPPTGGEQRSTITFMPTPTGTHER